MENIKDTQVRIQLIGDLKGYLNIEKDSVFPLTFSIADIRDVSKKKGTFSKSIMLSGDKNNNTLLNNYFDVNIVSGTFDINKLQYCNVIQNGIPILENALMQLISINKEQKNSNYEEQISYTVLIKDTTADFFSVINNKYLRDLDFTYLNLNNVYTANNVIASFDNTVEDGYRYVMPYNPSLTNDNQFDLTEFSPGIFAKTYFDQIFNTAGFAYNWVGMTGPEVRFDKLLIPYTGDVITLEKYEDPQYIVEAHKTSTQTYQNGYANIPASQFLNNAIVSEPTRNLLDNNIIDSDPLGLYAAGIYTSPDIPSFTNDIKFEVEIEYEITVQNNSAGTVYLQGIWFGDDELVGPDKRLKITPQLYSVRNGAIEGVFPIVQSANTFIPFDLAATSFPAGTTVIKAATSNITGYLNGLSANDEINLATRLQINFGDSTFLIPYKFYTTTGFDNETQQAKFNFKVKNTSVKFSTLVSGEYGYNTNIDMNLFVPEKIKQSDFIKSIFTMYNIYCEVDKDNLNTLNLISRDEYYDNGNIVDWTKKLAKERPQELKFLPELQKKKLLLTYKADKDVSNESYTKATNEIYGQLEFTFDNEYVKDIDRQELIFSPTPMTNTSFGAVCPMWAGGAPNVNIRILYAGEVYPTASQYVINDYPGATGVTADYYPFNSHWDRPITPTFDINFGVCSYYFMTYDYTETNNNLFNLHWRRTLNQINNGKMLTAHFNLNEVDINKMRLSDKIRIDNSWWNINSIKDYDANSKTPTKVELISIDDGLFIPYETRDAVTVNDASPLVSEPRNRIAGQLKVLKNINLSTADLPINGINNVIGSEVINGSINGSGNIVVSNANVMGNNNYVTAESFIVGSDNSVESPSYIQGNTNTVPSGVFGVSIVGDGIGATASNTLYTNNIVISQGGTINNVSINNIVPSYSAYTALLTRTGATAPVAVELFNSLGAINYAYYNTGVYNVTSSALFTDDKTFVICQNQPTGLFGVSLGAARITDSLIQIIQTKDSGTNDNDWSHPVSFEIRVY